MPTTSIVIRTLNEEEHLGNLLSAIKEQSYQDYEIVVVDSGSTDRTLAIAREHQAHIIQIPSRDFTFGYALNVGCRAARGQYLVFASAHVLPRDTHWLRELVAPFADPRVAMVYGRQMGDRGAKFSERMDLDRLFGKMPYNSNRLLDYANNANSAIRKALWSELPFDEYLFGLEDIAWARQVTERGHLVHYAPSAAIFHIHREAWHQVFNRYRREAIAAVRIGLPHPPQSRVDLVWPIVSFIKDLYRSFPNYTPARLGEIVRFRYYQSKGGRQGWYYDHAVDLGRDKHRLFSRGSKAVVIAGPGDAAYTERTIPDLKPGDILLRVECVGICKTDLEVFDGTLGYYRDGVAHYPIVPGHEYVGEIVEIGANNKYRERFAVGQRVVGGCIISRHADQREEVGVVNHDGAYAELVVVPGDNIYPVPQGLDARAAALTEPLAVVLRALRRLEPRLRGGATVAVVGAGPIGNFAAQVLARRGHRVHVFDRQQQRLDLLAGIADSTSTELASLDAFDAVVEATGAQGVLERLLHESRVGAALLLLGFPYGEMTYNFEQLVGGDKEVITSVGADRQDFEQALALLPELSVEPFIQTVLPLGEFAKAWEWLRAGTHFKILLTPRNIDEANT